MLKGFFKTTKQKEEAARELKQKELNAVDTNIRENEKFLEVLNKDSEGPFTDFSPKVMNATEISKRDELLASQNQLLTTKGYIEKDIENIDRYIGRLDIAEKVVDELISFQSKYTITYEEILEDIGSAANYLPQDPVRSKLILEELIKKIPH